MTRGAYLTLHLVPAALLAGAVAPFHCGRCTLLRFVVCIGALRVACLNYPGENSLGPRVLEFGPPAILFNPIIPIHITRDIWFFIDLMMAALFGLHSMATKQRFAP